jgi:hypothetical protein
MERQESVSSSSDCFYGSCEEREAARPKDPAVLRLRIRGREDSVKQVTKLESRVKRSFFERAGRVCDTIRGNEYSPRELLESRWNIPSAFSARKPGMPADGYLQSLLSKKGELRSFAKGCGLSRKANDFESNKIQCRIYWRRLTAPVS